MALMTNFGLDPTINNLHGSNSPIMNCRFRISLYCFLTRMMGSDMLCTLLNTPSCPTMSIMDNIHLDISMDNCRVGRNAFKPLYFKWLGLDTFILCTNLILQINSTPWPPDSTHRQRRSHVRFHSFTAIWIVCLVRCTRDNTHPALTRFSPVILIKRLPLCLLITLMFTTNYRASVYFMFNLIWPYGGALLLLVNILTLLLVNQSLDATHVCQINFLLGCEKLLITIFLL